MVNKCHRTLFLHKLCLKKIENTMGSYGKAIMTGFICRLCSEQKKIVTHLYGARARELNLLKKITLIPVRVDKYDKLPKTICESCIQKLDMQYKLIQQIRKTADIRRTHRLFHNNGSCPLECPLHGIETPLHIEEPEIIDSASSVSDDIVIVNGTIVGSDEEVIDLPTRSTNAAHPADDGEDTIHPVNDESIVEVPYV